MDINDRNFYTNNNRYSIPNNSNFNLDSLNISNFNLNEHSTFKTASYHIDSRYRVKKPLHIEDGLNYKLNNDPLSIIPNSSMVKIYIPNHSLNVDDKIIIENVDTQLYIAKNIIFQKNSNFIKIYHSIPDIIYDPNIIYYINISNFVPDSGNYYQNIPINSLNKIHQIYFIRNDTDIPSIDFFYIKINQNVNADSTYPKLNIHLKPLNLRGINLKYINANYPINENHFYGFQTIENISKDYIIIDTKINACPFNSSISKCGGNKIIIKKKFSCA